MDKRDRGRVVAEARERASGCPKADAWLAGGMASLAVGVWLLRMDDPFLLTLWGTGLVINGLAASVVGAGKALRVWE
jgi:hypothetical protein